jgi:5-methylcytosine-specific restriction endonuclease McrA
MPYPTDPEQRRKLHAFKKAWANANPVKQRQYERTSYYRNQAKKLARLKAYREAHQEQVRAKAREYARSHAAERLAYQLAHRQAANVNARTYRLAHPDEQLHHSKAYRARKAGAQVNDLSLAQWREIKEVYHHCCAYCDRPTAHLTQDHILALSKGGSHTVQNIVPACRSCNSKKKGGSPLMAVQPLLLTVARPRRKRARRFK